MPKSLARIEEVGEDYPLFYNFKFKPPSQKNNSFSGQIDPDDLNRSKDILEKLVLDEDFYNDVLDYIEKIDVKKGEYSHKDLSQKMMLAYITNYWEETYNIQVIFQKDNPIYNKHTVIFTLDKLMWHFQT